MLTNASLAVGSNKCIAYFGHVVLPTFGADDVTKFTLVVPMSLSAMAAGLGRHLPLQFVRFVAFGALSAHYGDQGRRLVLRLPIVGELRNGGPGWQSARAHDDFFPCPTRQCGEECLY